MFILNAKIVKGTNVYLFLHYFAKDKIRIILMNKRHIIAILVAN